MVELCSHVSGLILIAFHIPHYHPQAISVPNPQAFKPWMHSIRSNRSVDGFRTCTLRNRGPIRNIKNEFVKKCCQNYGSYGPASGSLRNRRNLGFIRTVALRPMTKCVLWSMRKVSTTIPSLHASRNNACPSSREGTTAHEGPGQRAMIGARRLHDTSPTRL